MFQLFQSGNIVLKTVERTFWLEYWVWTTRNRMFSNHHSVWHQYPTCTQCHIQLPHPNALDACTYAILRFITAQTASMNQWFSTQWENKNDSIKISGHTKYSFAREQVAHLWPLSKPMHPCWNSHRKKTMSVFCTHCRKCQLTIHLHVTKT